MSEQQQSYISRVHLKGYKSIRDTEITFQPGLNIIIGPNGSGKTNFLEFLTKILYLQNDFDEIESNIEINADFGNYITWSLKVTDGFGGLKKISDLISLNEKVIRNLKYELPSQVNALKYEREHFEFREILFPTIVTFNIPVRAHSVLNSFSSITIEYVDSKNVLNGFSPFKLKGDFAKLIGGKLLSLPLSIKPFQQKDSDLIKVDEKLKTMLAAYTPIKGLRLKDSLSYTISHNTVIVNNMMLQFRVGEIWLDWEQLSDGTKRIFYIFLEIFTSYGVAFLEEPELGIHPDQLNKLMLFLKQQAEEKQIILTTHSPQVLNILEEDELNRLIICRHEGEKGTKMVHLTEEEKHIAVEYMKEEPLSEYWSYIGIEAEQIDD